MSTAINTILYDYISLRNYMSYFSSPRNLKSNNLNESINWINQNNSHASGRLTSCQCYVNADWKNEAKPFLEKM